MKNLIFTVLLCLSLNQAVSALSLVKNLPGADIVNALSGKEESTSSRTRYPEEEQRFVKIYTGESPLAFNSLLEAERYKVWLKANAKSIDELSRNYGFNNFTLGTGRVDVTYQVKNGVSSALKESLDGYAEFERRKVADEIINSNFVANRLCQQFLLGAFTRNNEVRKLNLPFIFKTLGVDFIANALNVNLSNSANISKQNIEEESSKYQDLPSLFTLSKQITKLQLFRDMRQIFKALALSLLTVFASISVFQQMVKGNLNSHYIFVLLSFYLLINFSDALALILFELIEVIEQVSIKQIIGSIDIQTFETAKQTSWAFIANNVGYFPAIILSFLNLLVQFLLYFYIAGLMLHIVLGQILLPFWILFYKFASLRGSALSSINSWVKSLCCLALIPLIYSITNLILIKIHNFDIHLLNISFAIASILLIPIASNFILSRGSGILESNTSAYTALMDSIRDSVDRIHQFMENKEQQTC